MDELDIRSFWRRGDKAFTDDFFSVDVRKLAREYCLRPNSEAFILAGSVTVDLEWRQCHLGGYRVYFCCPRCLGRCCILYRFPKGEMPSDQYGCKKCLNLAHPVENEGESERAFRRFKRAYERRGSEDSSQPEGKPLWMRWPTWRRLTDQFLATIEGRLEYDEKMTERLRRLYKS
ncbi:hypothetical protein SAMN05216316_1268 [Nitrosovibrio sp. Nv6]|nr:hypothetical protein SAMN05216316_1268 [Nitrosovibrio sp. Nv6]